MEIEHDILEFAIDSIYVTFFYTWPLFVKFDRNRFLRPYFPICVELFCRRIALFWNLSLPTVDGDGGMRSRKHSSSNRITLLILSVLK